MSRGVSRLTIAAICLVASAVPHAQRDATPAPLSADGVIAGQVVTTIPSPGPVRRATVTLSGGSIERSTISTDDGRFFFEGLPSGRYTVRVRKAAWTETAFGAIRPGGAGTAIALAAGERRDITIPMLRGAVIEGRLTLPDGAPATRTSVRVVAADGSGVPRGVDPPITDDRGMYRIYGIPPGEYLVQASPPVIPAMMQALYRPSGQEIDSVLDRLASRTRSPQPGASRVAAPASAPAASQIVYAPVFYPGTATRESATPVALAAGHERLGIDFVFAPTPMSRVSGRLTAPVPSLAGAQVRLQQRGNRATIDARVSPDGTFVVPAVTPGVYDITAKLDPARRPTSANEPREFRMVDPAAAEPVSDGTLWGTAEVQVTGQDIEGLGVALVEGGVIAGRLRFSESAATPVPDMAGVRLRLTPAAQPQSPIVGPSGFTTVRETAVPSDGQFVIGGLAPGPQQLSVQLPAALTAQGWWARSAIAGGVDLLDAPTDLPPGSRVSDIDIVLSRQRSSLAGRLQLTDGRPGSDYFVIAFSTDSRAWQTLSRRTHATRPADDGVFALEDVPPGEYFLAVMSDFDAAMLSAPGFFEQAAAAAVRFTLAEGEQREQSFAIGR